MWECGEREYLRKKGEMAEQGKLSAQRDKAERREAVLGREQGNRETET